MSWPQRNKEEFFKICGTMFRLSMLRDKLKLNSDFRALPINPMIRHSDLLMTSYLWFSKLKTEISLKVLAVSQLMEPPREHTSQESRLSLWIA